MRPRPGEKRSTSTRKDNCNTPGVTQSPGPRSTFVSYSNFMLKWKVKELKVRGMVKISINHNKRENPILHTMFTHKQDSKTIIPS
jgi:hypothetical protein